MTDYGVNDPNYFALAETKELSANLLQKYNLQDKQRDEAGLRELWRKSYRYYYGRHWKVENWGRQSSIPKVGIQGELSAVTVNQYRNLIKHILVLTTNQKIVWDARAANTDSKSLIQARLANNILDYFLREKRLNRNFRGAAEQALVFGKSFNLPYWNTMAGKPIGVEPIDDPVNKFMGERIKYEGDVSIKTVSCWDYYGDQFETSWNNRQWDLVRIFVNKYDYARQYPQLAEKIVNLPSIQRLNKFRIDAVAQSADTPYVPLYLFFHARTPAIPNGREMHFFDSECVAFDSMQYEGGGLSYQNLPVKRITPGEIFDTTEGYTDAFDLMGPQEMVDVLHSSIYTNLATLGVTRILTPDQANLKTSQLSKSMVALKYDATATQGQKPEILDLANVNPNLFNYLNFLGKDMETLSGVNSVARGNPEAMGKNASGVSIGLVQSMAVQFASLFQESYAELAEDVGTFIIDILKKFPTTPKMITIAGDWNRGYMQEFKKEDISNVERVLVDLGNPMARTVAGRFELANMFLDKGMVKNPEEVKSVLNTGNIDQMMEAPQSAVDLIRQEREMMMRGEQPIVMFTDPHLMHIREHLTLLNNPSVRLEDPIAQVVLAHVQEHFKQYTRLDPAASPEQAMQFHAIVPQIISMVTGEPPPPTMMPMGPMPNMSPDTRQAGEPGIDQDVREQMTPEIGFN